LWSFYAQNGLVLFDKNNSRKSVTLLVRMSPEHNLRHRSLKHH